MKVIILHIDWMNCYAMQIDSIRINNFDNIQTIQEWNNILNKKFIEYKSNKAVSPLIETCWCQTQTNDHECPGYNSLVEVNNGCTCGHCTAGCVAIAMAQIMKKWNHPVYSTYSSYDWCNMPKLLCMFENCDFIIQNPNPSFEIQQIAIATLIHNCGTSANMDYCSSDCASGTGIGDARNAFVNNFGYDSDAKVKARFYHPFNWKNLLKDDLDNGRPIFYIGSGSYGGHAFVCDGYNSDNKFHFNWGWGCLYDDYFELSKLNPSSNFTRHQKAIFNLHPAWYINCNSVLHVFKIYEYISFLSHLYYNPVAGTIIAGGSGTPLTIQSGQTVHYKAYNQIILDDGFVAEEGSNFVAEIIPCPTECPDNSKSMITSSDNYNEEIELEYDTIYNKNTKKEIVKLKFQVYPNPFEKRTNIIYTVKENEKFDISIYNIYGIKLYSLINGIQPAGKYNLLYDTSNLPNGVYICIFSSKNRREIIKLLKY